MGAVRAKGVRKWPGPVELSSDDNGGNDGRLVYGDGEKGLRYRGNRWAGSKSTVG